MNKIRYLLVLVGLLFACNDTLEPEPVDLLTDDLVLNEPNDVPNVEIGLYSALRNVVPATVIAGDFTADFLVFNGTFAQYRELGTKTITTANASVANLWSSIYNTIYIANFVIERLPGVQGVRNEVSDRVLATAYFVRGYCYFVALNTYGGVPEVLTTVITDNRNIPRASEQQILNRILEDYSFALGKLERAPANPGFAGDNAVKAALARLYLYQENWPQAENFASQVINSGDYELENEFESVVNNDFTSEAIFEMGYTIADDPGTNTNIGLNNLFVGRREIIPSNSAVLALASNESGDRFSSISFNANNLQGNDNGWSVAKYGTADADNNNVVVFRLAEMYLIRAEARARQQLIEGENGGLVDLNTLRERANAPLVNSASLNQLLLLIEEERRYELAFEGHRWYDLVRTGRVAQVMPAFNSNWREAYEKWPIPQREIQNNPALIGNQNPGY